MATDTEMLAEDDTNGLPDDVYEALRGAAARWKDRDFMVVDHRAQVVSFAGLLDRADDLGRVLSERGVRRGDRVCLAMANSVEWIVTAFAVFGIGGVVVPLSTRLVDREVRHCLELARPRTVMLHETVRTRSLLDEWPSLCAVTTDDGAPIDLLVHSGSGDEWRPALPVVSAGRVESTAGSARVPAAPGELDGAAVILFTSGTTSEPKGVILTHRGLLRVAYEVGRRQDVGPDDHFFSVAPFFHCSGLMHALLTSLVAGATLFTASRYTADDSLRVMREERITVSHGPLPSPADMPATGAGGSGLATFTRAWAGGTSQQIEGLEAALGVKVCSLWGMTETGGCFALTTADDVSEVRHGSAGKPMPGLEFRIVVDGEVVGEGVPGELHVRGWNVTSGYYRDPAATAAAISDGWLSTGDLAERLPGGRFRFLARVKDIIRVGGENVSPLEVEEVLTGLAGVSDAAVVCQPDARLGEVPVAAVVTGPGVAITDERLRAHCGALLANFKVPRRFFLLERIPRTDATNRIQRAKVQADISVGRATHVP